MFHVYNSDKIENSRTDNSICIVKIWTDNVIIIYNLKRMQNTNILASTLWKCFKLCVFFAINFFYKMQRFIAFQPYWFIYTNRTNQEAETMKSVSVVTASV